jgi:hypothetical protein
MAVVVLVMWRDGKVECRRLGVGYGLPSLDLISDSAAVFEKLLFSCASRTSLHAVMSSRERHGWRVPGESTFTSCEALHSRQLEEQKAEGYFAWGCF